MTKYQKQVRFLDPKPSNFQKKNTKLIVAILPYEDNIDYIFMLITK